MGIAEHGWLAGSVQPIGIDQRMSLRRDDFNILHADAAQFAGYEIGGLLYIGFVLFQGTDARNTKKVFQFI